MMFYIQTYYNDWIHAPKKEKRSVWCMTIFDAIDELRRESNKLIEKYQENDQIIDYYYDNEQLAVNVDTEDASYRFVVIAQKDGTEYDVPDIETMINDHIETMNAMEEY